MNRVCLDEAAAAEKLNLENDQVVNVLKVVSNRLFSVFGITSSNDHVPGRS